MRHGALSEADGHRSKRTHALCNHLARGSKRSSCGDERWPLRSGSEHERKSAPYSFQATGQSLALTLFHRCVSPAKQSKYLRTPSWKVKTARQKVNPDARGQDFRVHTSWKTLW